MPEKIVQLNEEVIKGQLKELVRGSVEETLNELLEAEANKLTQAARYERNEQRQGYRSGHYNRNLTTTSGDITLKVPKLKGISFETAIIERYRRRESSAGEALIEMYWLAYPSSTWRECYRGTMRKQSVTISYFFILIGRHLGSVYFWFWVSIRFRHTQTQWPVPRYNSCWP